MCLVRVLAFQHLPCTDVPFSSVHESYIYCSLVGTVERIRSVVGLVAKARAWVLWLPDTHPCVYVHGVAPYICLRLVRVYATQPCCCILITRRFNRDDFVNNMNNTLRRRDLVKIREYYSRSPSSGIYFLEYGTRFVGLIAIDASTDSTSNEVIVSADSRARLSFTKGTSETAVIRHFHVEDPYRVANVQTDLLEFALKHTFEANSKVKSVKATELSLVKYYGKALREQGFKVEGVLDKVGSLGWQRKTWVLGRQTWEKREKRET